MGKVLNIKRLKEDKVSVNLELTTQEYDWLKGSINKMHLFSENNLEYCSRLVQRGKRESTKYFLLPKELRDGTIPSNNVKANRIETNNKIIYIFSLPRFNFK